MLVDAQAWNNRQHAQKRMEDGKPLALYAQNIYILQNPTGAEM